MLSEWILAALLKEDELLEWIIGIHIVILNAQVMKRRARECLVINTASGNFNACLSDSWPTASPQGAGFCW